MDTNLKSELPNILSSGTFPENDQAFSHRKTNGILDDEDILALYKQDAENCTHPEDVESDPNPFNFDIHGSTITISHSKNIQFGSTSVTPCVVGSSSGSVHPDISPQDSFDAMSFSSVTSASQLPNPIDFSKISQHTVCGQDGRRFSEGVSECCPQSYQVKINPPQSTASTASTTNGQKQLLKTMSTPSSFSDSSIGSINDLPIVQANSSTVGHPQMSAEISNSSNVQMGTQIVYNYFIHGEQGVQPKCSSVSLPEVSNLHLPPPQEPTKQFLVDFREKLISVYHKKTSSSPLPWHRGKQLIPINEYYTEPQIFGVDKFGNRTSEMLNLISILETGTETRLLVEGEAGMGKTFLATKLAEEWARGNHLKDFQLLFLVTLGDFHGSLEQYLRIELLPSYYEEEKFTEIWNYCKSCDKDILFVLDGYDELQRHDTEDIQNLIKSKDFPDSKVVVMCRPNILQVMEKTIVVSGFGHNQIMEFIEKYFRALGNDTCGQSLRKLIEKDDKCWKLAKRPLFCVLLCMLYITGDMGESLPERQCDVMLQIILCLIKWNSKSTSEDSTDFDALPPEYEKPFYHFGKLCLKAMKNATTRFSEKDVQNVEGYETKLKQLGFLYSDNERHALGEKKFWKPVHQTFLEYLGAFYMSRHLRECKGCKECKQYGVIFQKYSEVLKFCVGILNNKAYRLFDGQRFPFIWKLPIVQVLRLLKEAEPKAENCQAVAKLLDQSTVEISTSEIEFEGWSSLLSQNFRRLTTLKIAWRIKSRSPDQESSFAEASEAQYAAFFEALRQNESIRCIHVRAKHDGEPFTEEKISFFFKYLQNALHKKNLQELEINEMKMKASSYLREAIEGAANQANKVRALQDLRILKLHTFMKDQDLEGICEALQKCASSLETLHLEGLEHGTAGFKSLVRLLKSNTNIQYLHISMNQSLLVNAFGCIDDNSNDYAPFKMRNELQRMTQTAARKSKHAYSEHSKEILIERSLNGASSSNGSSVGEKQTQRSHSEGRETLSGRELNPKKELKYLFDNLSINHGPWSVEAWHYWYLKRSNSDVRIPLPVCVSGEHKSVFHFLFSALADTNIKNLTFNQAGVFLSPSDLICLGNAVRKSSHLAVLNVQCLEKVDSYLPLLIGIGQSSALTSVNLTSSKIVINDAAFEVICSALQNNTSLRNLSLGRWHFCIQNVKEAQDHLSKLLGAWQVSLLDLRQCIVDIGSGSVHPPTSPVIAPIEAFFGHSTNGQGSQPWRTVKTLNLEGVDIKQSNGVLYRGYHLLPGITKFINLTSLDLSVSKSKIPPVDNVTVTKFFSLIASDMKQLADLKMDGWNFSLQVNTLGTELASRLRSCRRLKKIQLQGVNENVPDMNGPNGFLCKNTLLHHLITYLPSLEDVALCNYKINGTRFDNALASKLGACLHDHFHHTPFSVTFFNLSSSAESAITHELQRPPCRVKKTVGSALRKTFDVKCSLSLVKRPWS